MDWPNIQLPNGPAFTVHSPWGAGSLLAPLALQAGTTSISWPSADLSVYAPFQVGRPVVITKMAVVNGATASGNIDLGIYTADGTRLVSSGAIAQAGTSTLQVVDITDTLLGPGVYYLALGLSSTSGTVLARTGGTAATFAAAGMREAALTSMPLSPTVTLITYARTILPNFGAIIQTIY